MGYAVPLPTSLAMIAPICCFAALSSTRCGGYLGVSTSTSAEGCQVSESFVAPPTFVHELRAQARADRFTGFDTYNDMPLSAHLSLSPRMALAVHATMGKTNGALPSQSRISRVADHPSLIGMLQSMNTQRI